MRPPVSTCGGGGASHKARRPKRTLDTAFLTYSKRLYQNVMLETTTIAALALLLPLTGIITYFDVRYRRIPNLFVLATLVSGLLINFVAGGLDGLWASAGGCLLAFGLMFLLHVFGAMGAGDVKLFAAVGS